jgi:hypothetical protein
MSAAKLKYYKVLFLVAAVYDILLGIIFTFFYKPGFSLLGVSINFPGLGGYISLIGSFLLVIGVAYYLIYRGDLIKNRDLVLIGTLYKLAYCSTAFFYFALGEVPNMIFVFVFGLLDLIMFLLMAECYMYIGKILRAGMAAQESR